MGFLLDTNILSELRKERRCAPAVMRWYEATPAEDLFTSVLVLGELRFGIENLRHRDAITARALEKWLREIQTAYAQRVLPISAEISDIWGRISISSRIPDVDALLAATALHHRLTFVTRNTRDVKRSGADCLDPFID